MTTPFPRQFHPIVAGENVTAGITNRPLNELDQRTNSLREKIENAQIGSALFNTEVPVAGDVKLGMAVYRDNDGVFRSALAAMELASDNATIQPALSCYAWGVVQYKHSNVLADIVLAGVLRIREEDLEAVMVDGAVHTGPLYLSGTPGKKGFLTHQQPPIGFGICMLCGPDGSDADGEPLYTMAVSPSWKNPLEGHIHFHARLSNDAGDWDAVGGDAPAGAVYKYDKDSDTVLSALWPPIPIGAVHYDLTGIATDLINNTQILINDDGIYWMDAVNDPQDYRHDFYFLRMTFKNNNAVVTSLEAADATMTVTDLDGNAASTGRLKAKVNLVFTQSSNQLSGVAVKVVDGLLMKFGPVVEGISTDTPDYVVISGGTALAAPYPEYKKGLIKINALDPSGVREGPVDFVELDNVELEKTDGIHYLQFDQGVDGTVRGRIRIPETGLPDYLTVTIEVVVWALSNGDLPDMAMEYLIITPSAVPGAIPTTYTPMDDLSLSSVGTVASGDGFKIVSSGISVGPGDIVIFTISRDSGDTYPGKIGFIDQRWKITPAESTS